MKMNDDFFDWLNSGIDKGWVSQPYCNTHDGGQQYWTEEEMKQWEDGGDPCQTVIRILGVDE